MPISTRHSGATAVPSSARVSSIGPGSGTPVACHSAPSNTGSVTGCTTALRTVLFSVRHRLALASCSDRVRARSTSTSMVHSVSSTSACRLISATWIPSPASPNSAATTGTPTWAELPKVAAKARTEGCAAVRSLASRSAPAASAGWRSRCQPYSSST